MKLKIHTKQITVRDDLLTGLYAQSMRKLYNKTLRDISELTRYSIGYISDLEHGRKKWTDDKLKWYEMACIGIKKNGKE